MAIQRAQVKGWWSAVRLHLLPEVPSARCQREAMPWRAAGKSSV